MPQKSVLVIGSGPIIIGQAAEFDYAGVQACRALREEGHRVVLVNSNPATIMTDPEVADAVYLEPLTVPSIERIIERERPDALLPTLGGQTGLNLAVELSEAGVLDRYGVELLGTPVDTIKLAEDRERFKAKMIEIGEPVATSVIVTQVDAGVAFANEHGYPLVVRPAYTLGGTGGGIVHDERELIETLESGLAASLIHQVLLETSLLGWKEIEYEVLRDGANNCIIVCNMENIDPVGVHTGDSIVVAPSQTLSDLEYQMLRTSSLNVIRALNVQGGCNIQFALHPERSEYAIIEVNPRVSRSSALASKATGYPIAKISTRIALGQTLDEIPNPVTGVTKAAYEPTLDYVVVKIPRWPFDKFPLADTSLGTQMKSTGEAMGIGRTFQESLMKAVRGLDLKREMLTGNALTEWSDAELENVIAHPNHERLFAVAELLRRQGEGAIPRIIELSAIDKFWLYEIAEIVKAEEHVVRQAHHDEGSRQAHHDEGSRQAHHDEGFRQAHHDEGSRQAHHDESFRQAHHDEGSRQAHHDEGSRQAHHDEGSRQAHHDEGSRQAHHDESFRPAHHDEGSRQAHHDESFRQAHHDESFRQAHHDEGSRQAHHDEGSRQAHHDEGSRQAHHDGGTRHPERVEGRTVFRMVDTAAAEFPAKSPYYYIAHDESDEMRLPPREAVVVVGSGPIRIGQGIEFDYSCVHAAWALREAGCSPVVINNNPETVSTDFDISDVLIFEPPGADEVEAAYRSTNARGVMLAFGGQTAINLADELARRGVNIIGSDRHSLDMAEDREKFDAALRRLGVARPEGKAARSFREARAIARELGFPVLVRPSYVLGGRGMEVVYNEGQLASYAESAPPILAEAPLLVDKYLRGLEAEVDAAFDGDDILIPGIFEHIERAGIHSGDSISVYPAQTISAEMKQRIVDVTTSIARELNIRGLINIQFVIHKDQLYIIEANPRASRTVPIIQKATGVNLVAAATRIALGEKLRDMPYGTGLTPEAPFVVVKIPVFSFAKMRGVETILGPEMKSTGEVLGIDETFAGALGKGFIAAGVRLPSEGGRILVSIADEEKEESIPILERYVRLGHTLIATPGTREFLEAAGIPCRQVNKIADGSPHVLDLIHDRGVDLVINDAQGPRQISDNYRIRRAAVEANIGCLTSLDTARALAEALENTAGPPRSLQEYRCAQTQVRS